MPDTTPADPKGQRNYRLISADSHVNEPPDLWTARAPSGFEDRVPRMERFEDGDAWIVEGMDQPMPFGLNAGAGIPRKQREPWMFWEDVRAGGYDPAARIEEMDEDQVDGEVLFPTPRLFSAVFANPDPELHLVMVRAYNDWITEFAGHDPSRLRALPVLPNVGVDEALAEIARVCDRPGVGGVNMGQYPHGGVAPSEEDDPVWAELIERDLTVNIHVAMSPGMPKASGTPGPLPGAGRHIPIGGQLLGLIFSGTFDRFPDLHVVAAEVDCGWLPYFKEQCDDNFRRFNHRFDLPRCPSEYFEEHVSFTFVTDGYGVANRHLVGVDRMMWSSDYPHPSASWPMSWSAAGNLMANVPPAERNQILAGNALRIYGFAK